MSEQQSPGQGAARPSFGDTTPAGSATFVEQRDIMRTPGAGDRVHRKFSPVGALLLTLSCLSPALSVYSVSADVLRQAATGAAGLFLLGVGAAAEIAGVA